MMRHVCPEAAARTARARRSAGRDRSGGRQLLLVLALVDVLLHRRSDDLPARVRVRLRVAGLARRRLRLHLVRRHRDRRDDRAVLGLRSRRCMGRSSSTSSSTPTTRSSRRRSTCEELVTGEALWIAARAGVYGCVPMLVAMVFGLTPSLGHAAGAADRRRRRLRLGRDRDLHRRQGEVDRELLLLAERPADADVPRRRHLLPADQAADLGAGARQLQPSVSLRAARPPRRVRLCRDRPTSAIWRSWSCSRS